LREQNTASESATPATASVVVNALNFRYRVERDTPPWRPRFDDGHNVCIEFPNGIDQGEMPLVREIGPEGRAASSPTGSRGTT
jgi:type IV secretion system protein TrbG